MKKIILLVSIYSLINVCMSNLTREYENCVVVNYDHGVLLHWTIDRENQKIAFGFHGNLGGYIGLGLSNNGKILGGPPLNYTDVWAIDTNFRYVDLWFTSAIFQLTSQPATDKQQDLKNATLSYNGTALFGEFYRALDTKDPFDYVIPLNESVFVVWAGHHSIPWIEGIGYANHRLQNLTYEGAITVNFNKSSSCSTEQTPGLWESTIGDFQLRWALTADGKSINFTMTGVTYGWISFGLGTQPKMYPSDVYVGWITEGQVSFYDSYSTDYNQPTIDTQQDVSYVSGYQEDGKTTISFQRLLVTADPQDLDITDSSIYLLYALANVPGSGTTYPMHTSIGITPMNFFGGAVPPEAPLGQHLPTNGTFRPSGARYTSSDGMFSIVCEVIGPYMYFEMSGKTTGWISIGLSYDSLMPNSDTYTGWINADGTVVIRDEWSPNYLQPFEDTQYNGTDNAILTDAIEADGQTLIAFKRLLVTGDRFDLVIDSNVAYLNWAIGSEDGNAYGYSEHFLTGDTSVNLLASNPFAVSILNLFRPGHVLLIIVAITMLIWSTIRGLRYWRKSMTKRQVYHKATRVLTDSNSTTSSSAEDEARSESVSQQVDMITTYINVGDDLGQDAEIPINSPHSLLPPPESPPPRGVVFQNGKYIGNLFVSTGSSDSSKQEEEEHASVSAVDTSPIRRDSIKTPRCSARQLAVNRKSSLYPDLRPEPVDSIITAASADTTQGDQTEIPVIASSPWTGSLASKTNRTILHKIEGIVTLRIPNTDVSVGDIITTVFYVIFNIMCLFILQDIRVGLTIEGAVMNIGSLIGANCVLTVMVATKNSLLVILLGIPFDRVVIYHRWLGRFCCILTGLHFTLITAKYSLTNLSMYILNQWVTISSPTSNLYGLLGAISLLFVLMSSLEWIRRTKYEVFILLHYILFTIFFIFGSLHTPNWWCFAITALVLYGMDIMLRVFWGNLPQKTSLAVVKPGGMTRIKIRKRLPFLNKGRVGQYVFVNVPKISLHEWHPFSVSSAPFEKEIEINVRPAGDWTTKLKTLVEKEDQIWIRVDGPYGHLNLNYRRYEHILLVAGGVGITPVIGFLKTIYFNPKRVQSRIKNVTAIWAIRAETEATLFSEEFDAMHKIAKINGEMPQLDLRIHLTTATDGPVPTGIYPGRPDMVNIFSEMVDEMQGNACFVFVCGPRPLVNSCWDISRRHALKGRAFHFHHETFLF